MKPPEMPHEGHENHLCYLENLGYLEQVPEAFKDLVRGAKYMCRNCGRAAASSKNLCMPERL